jgi:hypothetical protein
LQVQGLANNIIILSSCINNSKSSQKWQKLSLVEVGVHHLSHKGKVM